MIPLKTSTRTRHERSGFWSRDLLMYEVWIAKLIRSVWAVAPAHSIWSALGTHASADSVVVVCQGEMCFGRQSGRQLPLQTVHTYQRGDDLAEADTNNPWKFSNGCWPNSPHQPQPCASCRQVQCNAMSSIERENASSTRKRQSAGQDFLNGGRHRQLEIRFSCGLDP